MSDFSIEMGMRSIPPPEGVTRAGLASIVEGVRYAASRRKLRQQRS